MREVEQRDVGGVGEKQEMKKTDGQREREGHNDGESETKRET